MSFRIFKLNRSYPAEIEKIACYLIIGSSSGKFGVRDKQICLRDMGERQIIS